MTTKKSPSGGNKGSGKTATAKKKSINNKLVSVKAAPPERRKVARKPYVSPLGIDVVTIEKSFKLLEPCADELVQRFYEQLFKRYPTVRPLFQNTSQITQTKKFLATLKLVITNLRNPDLLVDTLMVLGKRHKNYGALPEHYAAVASTLLDVLKEFTGDMWTQKIQYAWSDALETVAATMLNAYGVAEDGKSASAKKSLTARIYGEVSIMDDLEVMKDILEYAPVNVMIADAEENIVFVNKKARDVLSDIEEELASYLPGFSVSDVLGGSIHRYHKDPSTIKLILQTLGPNDKHHGEITPGKYVFEHETRALYNSAEQVVGYVVQWLDITEMRRKKQSN